ncbi:ABC transporter ATP-binding protein [Ureaplasma canigenitalium]|uniref:ABC transporter ATP-binding protein n=1 Tax=Ureaplasma canigenitalium TaxID=42092 RepID=UPI0004E22CFB|nr:ABC transporter ATP-binding protein [Ureaplasma canigenitalium]
MNDTPYAIEMEGITKTFLNGAVVANKDVKLKVKKNEIHAIIGENGAGKSTLMSILFGIYKPDKGTIKINGNYVFFDSAKDATKLGIGMVHQHFKLIDTFSVLDNVILGQEQTFAGAPINRRFIELELKKLIDDYNLKINPRSKIAKLTVGQQQKTEILKLLYREIDILIFDEPTAVLSEDEIKAFLQSLRDFKKAGKTIVIITHKFNEIKEVADTATVIRRGEYIDSFPVKDKTIEEMTELMVGRKVVEIKNSQQFVRDENTTPVLQVKNLNLRKILKKQADHLNTDENQIKPIDYNLNFSIMPGEIFAIAGVEGNGQSELAEIISGLLPAPSGSEIIFNGKNITHQSIKNRYTLGMAHVPEDRHKHGLILDDSIAYNVVLQEISNKPYSTNGFVKYAEIEKKAIEVIKKFDVRGTKRGDNNARGLSGGNQQKLIIGREIEREHNLILMIQPTRGLDLGAIEFIHQNILEEKKKGRAVLLISYELDEILSLADTIAVINVGSFIGVGPSSYMTRNKIGKLMAGEK